MDIKNFVATNWKNADELKTLLGTEADKTQEFHFGSVPTEQAFDELGEFTQSQYEFIITWNRHGQVYPGQPVMGTEVLQ